MTFEGLTPIPRVPDEARTDTINRLLRRRAALDGAYLSAVDRARAATAEAIDSHRCIYQATAQSLNDLIETLRDAQMDRPIQP